MKFYNIINIKFQLVNFIFIHNLLFFTNYQVVNT